MSKKYDEIIDELAEMSDDELQELIEEADEEYDNWHVDLSKAIENLQDDNKIFLNKLIKKHGDKVIYIIYGYLNSDSLLDYNYLTDGGVSEFINEFNDEDTLKVIELFIDFQRQELEYNEDEIDLKKELSYLKKEVRKLKNKNKQPTTFINTKQFNERYGYTPVQQKGMRSKRHDPLPFTRVNQKTIHYNVEEVEKWLENYKVLK